jgi:hypothetical protein
VTDEYHAAINLDYSNMNGPGYQRILKALEGAGWEYVETSAMAYDGDLPNVLLALEMLARALPSGGTISAVTIHIQRVGAGPHAPGAGTPANARAAVLQLPLPSAAAPDL